MGKRRGRILIEVGSPEELERIVALLGAADVVRIPEAAG